MAKEDPQMKIRLPIELKEKIQELATKNNRSMNAEIVYILNLFIEDKEKISTFSKKTYINYFSNLVNLEDKSFEEDIDHYIESTVNLAQSMSTPAKKSFIKQFMNKHRLELEEKIKDLENKKG